MWFLTPSCYFLSHPISSNSFDHSVLQASFKERSMYPIFFTLSALLSLAAVHATDQLSGVPSCTFNCPTEDLASFPLGDHSDDGVTLFCSYPAFPGGGAGDFSCKYDVSFFHGVTCSFQLISFNRVPAHSRRTATQVFVPRQPSPPAPKSIIIAQPRSLRPLQRQDQSRMHRCPTSYEI
jgi:hypothetical protein